MLKLLYIFVLKKTVNADSFFMQLLTSFFFLLRDVKVTTWMTLYY